MRELYDLGEHYLIVVTDRISAFDYVLDPAVPDKGNVLNRLSAFWFDRTAGISAQSCGPHRRGPAGRACQRTRMRFANRIMVTRKAERVDIECVVRGYITGGGWRQYETTGEIERHQASGGLAQKRAFLGANLHSCCQKRRRSRRGHPVLPHGGCWSAQTLPLNFAIAACACTNTPMAFAVSTASSWPTASSSSAYRRRRSS